MAVIPTQPLFQAPPAPDRSDASLAFEKGHTSLIGSGSQLLRGFGGEILRGLGLEEMGQNWIGDAYARGILMGMDVAEIDEQMTGPRTMRDIEDWKGAVAWGVNSVAEQVPTLVGQFAPAVVVGALTRNPTLTTATALGTIDFMNTSEVYSQLLMEAGESRPALSIGTGVAMTSLDALLPLRVINRMKKGSGFASFFGRKLKNPDRKLRHTIAGALEAGALEGSTEYFQTVFENLALQYVKENDMMAEFSEEMMHEQEEAGARGALIGTLLGVPVSYMGVRRAAKAKADWVTGIMEQQNAFINQSNLLTFNPSVPSGSPSLEEFNAPITTAINDKILESQIEWQRGDPTTQARERTARIMRDNWEGLLNADMEATLDRGDKSLLSALIGAERKKMSQRMTLRAGTELAPYDEVQARRRDEVSPPTFEGTIPVEDLRDKTLRMGMAGITGIYPQEPGTGPDRTDAQGRPVPGGEISLAAAGKGAEIGWSETARKPMIKEDGSSEVGDKGKPRFSITYDNGEVILERETPEGFKEGTTSRLSPWVVIDKESGEIRERGTNQLQLKKKYAAAPLAGGQKVRPAERVARTKDVLSQTYEKRLSEEGKLPPGVADKVRLRNREGEPSNDSFTIQNIWYTQGAKPGQLSAQAVENREKLPKDQRTRESFEKGKGKVQTVYHLKNDRTDADLHVILPKAWELIILRSAPQTLREFGTKRITPAEEAYIDPLISAKEKEELYEYTEAGGFITDIKKRRANLREFEKLMEDEKYRDRFIVALANAQAIRGERVHQNVNKYSVSPKSVIDKFIEDSAKSREEMGMPYARALQEEREAFAQMSEEQKGIKLENVARERLIKQAETTREALSQEELDDYQVAVDRGVVPDISPVSLDAETREGLGLTAVRDPSQGLDLTETGEEAPRKQRYVWKQDPAFTKILKQYAEEQGTTVKKLTREDVEIVQKDLWPDGKPIGSTKISTKREPGTDETIKSQQAVAAGAITRRLGRVDKAAKELERAKVTEDLDKKAEAAGITVVRPEAYPKGVPIIDVRDLETDSVPSPATHTVKVSPEVAGKKGLNPKFFYLYEVSKWGEPRGYIKILGQHIKKEDVIEVEGIKEARRVPAVERFIKVDSPENINIFKRGKFAGVERLVDIPESIPGHETISAAWVDPESGAIVVQRETEAGLLATAPVSKITGPWERGKPDIPERFDPDFYRTYEIYITWENREEHALILEELKDRLLNISRSITEPTAPTGEFEKTKIRDQLEYTSIVDLEKNKDFLSKNLDKNIKSGLISVQLVPSMVGRINKERRKEGLYALPIDTRFRVSRVMRETGKGPIGMHYIEEIKKRITPRAVRTRKGRGPLWKKAGEEVDVFQLGVDIPPVETVETNRIRISHMGYSREVPLTKATKAFVKKSGIPERIGLFTEYNTLVVDGPAKGTRLMASFNTNIKDDLVEMEQFFYEMFDPATHAFGRWGENKDIIASKRAQDLKAHEGVMAQVRFFDGGLMEGTIGKVREKAGTFELITTKEEWKRKLPIEMDILGYDVIQFDEPAISKEKVKPYEYGDVVGGEPTDMAITGHRYLPAVFKSEEIVEEAAPVTAEGKTRVEVIKSQPSPEGKRGAERYTIVVDGVAETNALGGDKWGVKQTVTFLNNLERGSPEGLEVVSMPNEIATEVSPTSAVAISAEGEATVTGRHPISFARTDFIAPPVDKRVLPGKVPIGWEPEPKGKGTVSTVYTDIAKNIEQHEKQTADRLKAIADAVDKINKPPVVEGEPTVVEDAVAPVALGMDWDTTRLITTREEALEVQAALRKSWEAFNETRKAERKSVVRHPLMEQIWPDGETTTYRLDVLNPPTAKEKKAATAPVTPAPPVQETTELDQLLSAEARLAAGETAVDTGVTETEVDTDVTETDVTDDTDVTAPVVTDEQAQEFDKLTQETFNILGKEGEITQAEIKKIQAEFKKFGLKPPTAAQIREREVELTPAVAGDLGVIDSIVKTATKGKESVPLYIAKQTDTNDKVLTSEEVKNKTLRELPLNQKFHDGVGGQWQKMQQMGDHRTLLKFIEGRAPQLEFQVEVEGKKGTTKFGPGWMIDADASSTPSNLYLVSGVEGLFTGKKVSVQETFARFKKDQPPLIENFSVIPESIENDGRGRITYNTGLTPKEFRDEVSKRTGKLALTRLEKMGIIRIVQNQQDVPNPPSGMGVKSVERDGQAWFITNNIKREEIGGVFAHDLGVHVGMVNIYGQKTVSHILSSARAMRDSSDDWRDSFGLAEKLFSFITQAPASISEAAREQWATYTPEEAQAFITEEAIGYYAQRVDPYAGRKKGITNDLWTMLVDLVRRQSARIKRWLGKAMSEEEIIAFIRGGIRGAHNRNIEQASIRKTENYSAILDSEKGMGLDQKAIDTANAVLNRFTSERALENVSLARAIKDKVMKFFYPIKPLTFSGMYKQGRSLTQGRMSEAEEEGQVILKAFENLPDPDNLEIFNYLTNPGADPSLIKNKEYRDAAIKYKGFINKIGREAVERGIIPEDQLITDAYLPQIFLKNLLSTKNPTSSPWGRKPSQLHWAKERIDMHKEMKEMQGEIMDVRYLIYKAYTVPTQDLILLDFLQGISTQVAFEEGKAPWVLPNQWLVFKVTDPRTGKIITKRRTIAAIRREIEGFQAVANHADTTERVKKNIDTHIGELEAQVRKYYIKIGAPKNPTEKQVNDAVEKYHSKDYDTKNFRPLPTEDRFGGAKGLWIRKEIYDDILGNAEIAFGEVNPWNPFGSHTRMARWVSIFKLLKVPLNPPSAARNFITNSVNMQLLGGMPFSSQPSRLRSAFRAHYKNIDDGPKFNGLTAYQIAKKYGISGTTLVSAEIRQLEDVFRGSEKEGIFSILHKLSVASKKIGKTGAQIYQMLEVMGKTALIQYYLEHKTDMLREVQNLPENLGPDGKPIITLEYAAVMEANRVLFDYSEVSPIVRGLRSSFFGAPFITFQVKVLPELIKTAARHPLRFWPYVAFYASAQALFGSNPFEDDEWDQVIRLAPEWIRERGSGFIMPFRDENGRLQVADLSYFFPWSGITQTMSGLVKGEWGQAAREAGLVAPGWQLANALLSNRDTFTGREIINENDSSFDKGYDTLSYAWQMAMPNVLTRRGFVNMPSLLKAVARMDPDELEGKIFDATFSRENRYGEPKRDVTSAMLSLVGLNLTPIPSNARGVQIKRYLSKERGLKADITSIRTDKSLTKKQRDRQINHLRLKIDEAREERREFSQETAGVGAVLSD